MIWTLEFSVSNFWTVPCSKIITPPLSSGNRGRLQFFAVPQMSYFEIVFSVLTGFSVNFTLGKKAVGIYSGIYKDTHQSKGNMSTEVFDHVKIETDIVCNLQWSQNNGT
jgi:hypothetical protein